MKTLADVKRKMTLGSKWRCVRLFEGGKDLGVREVGKAVSYTHLTLPTN